MSGTKKKYVDQDGIAVLANQLRNEYGYGDARYTVSGSRLCITNPPTSAVVSITGTRLVVNKG